MTRDDATLSAREPVEVEVARLRRQLERERRIRQETEALAERATRELYDKQRDVSLLQAAAALANEAPTLEDALRAALELVCGFSGWPVGHVYLRDPDDPRRLVPMNAWCLSDENRFASFRELTGRTIFQEGEGIPGRVAATGEPTWVINLGNDGNFPRAPQARALGLTTGLAFPVLSDKRVVAVLEFFTPHAAAPDQRLLELLKYVGAQLGRVYERHRAQDELRAKEEYLRTVINTSPLILTVIDKQGTITSSMGGGLAALGRQPGQSVGRNVFRDYAERPEIIQLAAGALAGERCVMTIEESGIFFETRCTALRDSRGDVTGAVIVAADITDRKKAQEALEQKTLELERSNRELEQFAYVASHDLQEPLRMVASYTQLLQRRYEGQLDADADEFIRFAVDGAQRMQKLINDLLAYARVGTRGRPFGPTSSEQALRTAIVNLQNAMEETGAQVTHGELPTVVADGSQLVQLFQNLLSNALKFRAEAPPRVHVEAQREGAAWRFSVRDNGIGIDPQYADRIFLVFQRLHTRGDYPGTGIGLSICKRIVERHGGEVWVESAPGAGSTFYFTIPDRSENEP